MYLILHKHTQVQTCMYLHVQNITQTHTHTHLKPNNKCGCSSTIHYVCTDPGGWSTLSSSLAEPFRHHLSWSCKTSQMGGKSNFKGWRLFLQIFRQYGIARTHAMQLSVWLDFTDCDSSALNVDRKSPQRPYLMPKVYRYLAKYWKSFLEKRKT